MFNQTLKYSGYGIINNVGVQLPIGHILMSVLVSLQLSLLSVQNRARRVRPTVTPSREHLDHCSHSVHVIDWVVDKVTVVVVGDAVELGDEE